MANAATDTANCTFCDIVQGAAEVSMCYEDDTAMAFMDIQPVNAGHVLVVPKVHYALMSDVPRDVGRHIYEVAMKLVPVIQEVAGTADINMLVSSGKAAGQDVFHYHMHLIPRRPDDGFDVPLPFANSEMPERERLDACAARIIAALRDPMRVE